MAAAFQAAALLAQLAVTHQGNGQLVGQEFVIGEAAARRREGGKLGLLVRTVRLAQGLCPGGPVLPSLLGRVEPLRQERQALDRGMDGLADHLEAEARRQGIDRLDGFQALGFLRPGDVIGVGHLQAVVEDLDLAADHPGLPRRQRPGQVVAVDVEEHELQAAAVVVAEHAVGLAPVRRRPVLVDLDRQGGDAPGDYLRQGWSIAPVDDSTRQVPAKVDHRRSAQQALEKLGETRADAGQAGGRGKEREEDFGAHGRDGAGR